MKWDMAVILGEAQLLLPRSLCVVGAAADCNPLRYGAAPTERSGAGPFATSLPCTPSRRPHNPTLRPGHFFLCVSRFASFRPLKSAAHEHVLCARVGVRRIEPRLRLPHHERGVPRHRRRAAGRLGPVEGPAGPPPVGARPDGGRGGGERDDGGRRLESGVRADGAAGGGPLLPPDAELLVVVPGLERALSVRTRRRHLRCVLADAGPQRESHSVRFPAHLAAAHGLHGGRVLPEPAGRKVKIRGRYLGGLQVPA